MSEEHHHEESSIEEAKGSASGFTGTIENWNADSEQKFTNTLMAVGRFVQGESGCMLGHLKAAIYVEDGKGITLNLIDMDNGVEHHGILPRADIVKFNFMCAVLDVEKEELLHVMIHAIDDSGLDYHIDKDSLRHHHHDNDDHECHHHHHHIDSDEFLDDNGKLRADHECHHHHHGE